MRDSEYKIVTSVADRMRLGPDPFKRWHAIRIYIYIFFFFFGTQFGWVLDS